MARMRTLKPEFWTDSRMVQLSAHARLLFMGMWNFADDDGVLEDDPLQIKLRVLPADAVDASGLVQELVSTGCVRRAVTPDGENVLVIPKFKTHQKPQRPTPSAHGDPATFTYHSASTQRGLTEDSVSAHPVVEGSGGVSSGVERSAAAESRETALDLPDTFDDLWTAWPKRQGTKGSKKKAQQRWRNLTRRQQQKALTAAPVYAQWCQQSDTPPQDCITWLNQDRFDEDWEAALQEARAGPANVRHLPRHLREEQAQNDWLTQWVASGDE